MGIDTKIHQKNNISLSILHESCICSTFIEPHSCEAKRAKRETEQPSTYFNEVEPGKSQAEKIFLPYNRNLLTNSPDMSSLLHSKSSYMLDYGLDDKSTLIKSSELEEELNNVSAIQNFGDQTERKINQYESERHINTANKAFQHPKITCPSYLNPFIYPVQHIVKTSDHIHEQSANKKPQNNNLASDETYFNQRESLNLFGEEDIYKFAGIPDCNEWSHEQEYFSWETIDENKDVIKRENSNEIYNESNILGGSELALLSDCSSMNDFFRLEQITLPEVSMDIDKNIEHTLETEDRDDMVHVELNMNSSSLLKKHKYSKLSMKKGINSEDKVSSEENLLLTLESITLLILKNIKKRVVKLNLFKNTDSDGIEHSFLDTSQHFKSLKVKFPPKLDQNMFFLLALYSGNVRLDSNIGKTALIVPMKFRSIHQYDQFTDDLPRSISKYNNFIIIHINLFFSRYRRGIYRTKTKYEIRLTLEPKNDYMLLLKNNFLIVHAKQKLILSVCGIIDDKIFFKISKAPKRKSLYAILKNSTLISKSEWNEQAASPSQQNENS